MSGITPLLQLYHTNTQTKAMSFQTYSTSKSTYHDKTIPANQRPFTENFQKAQESIAITIANTSVDLLHMDGNLEEIGNTVRRKWRSTYYPLPVPSKPAIHLS